jgi:hypothetical protein
MNLLSIQDALKNASDDQLKNLITSPDSTAPSYLVLSELRRRQEMRAQQAQEPRGTVAEDLTSEENMQAPMGIRSLSTPEPGDEDYPTEEGDGIQAMREGGAVHMYQGDVVEAKEDGDRSRFGQLFDYATGQFRSAVEDAPRAAAIRNEIGNRMSSNSPISYFFGSPREHTQAGDEIRYLRANQGNRQFDVEAFRRDPAAYMQANPLGPRAGLTPPPAPVASAAPPAAEPPAPAEGGAPPEKPQTRTALPGNAGGVGIRALNGPAAPAAPAAEASSGLPTIAQNMERNLALFPGIPQELLDRIKASRTNEGERRSEARRMALVEAGLRIAASRNPSLAGAIGEGAAPAVQSYNQQIGQIRQDQNADLTRDLAVAQADLQRRYMAGQISASELQRQTQILVSRESDANRLRIARASESGANARLVAQETAAQRRHDAIIGGQRQQLLIAANRDVSKEVNDVMGDTIRLETARRQYTRPGQPAPTNSQLQALLRSDAVGRIYPDFGLDIPASVSGNSRAGATVQSGVSR